MLVLFTTLSEQYSFCLSITVSPNGLYVQTVSYCLFKGFEVDEVEYNIVHYFNKDIIMTWNGTQGNWTGRTARGIYIANIWNDNPFEKLQHAMEKLVLCDQNIPFIKEYAGNGINNPVCVCSY